MGPPRRGYVRAVRDVPLSTASGFGVGLSGLGFVGIGLWARREVARTLAQERITGIPDGKPVTSGAAARQLADVIRLNTLEAAGGRTYAETDPYVGAAGGGTSDAALALKDERTGAPVEHPEHALWVQSTTLQTALTQAYVASRLAELTVALGAALAVVGVGLVAAGSRRRRALIGGGGSTPWPPVR